MRFISNKIYFSLKGNIGFYKSKVEAINHAGGKPNDVLTVRESRMQSDLMKELKFLAGIRGDLNFLKYKEHVGDRTSYLEYINNGEFYVTAYYNRIITEDSFKYGIILAQSGGVYGYINPTTKVYRGSQSDIYPLLKIKEWEELYGIKGTIKTPIPVSEKELKNILPRWKIEMTHPADYGIMEENLNRMLKGQQPFIDIKFIQK